MKHLFFSVLAVLIFLGSCTTHKNSIVKKSNSETYSVFQTNLINKEENKTPMRILQITNEKDSVILRTKSQPIDLNTELETTKKLAKRLLTTVNDPKNPGVGIAAPQVGILKQMIAVQRFDKKEIHLKFM